MTLIERFKLDYPNNNGYNDNDVEDAMIGCPRSYGYTDPKSELESCGTSNYDHAKYPNCCVACWNREIPEAKEAEPELTINLKEEKKMKDLSSTIRNAVLCAISDHDIEEAVENFFDDYDYSDLIREAVNDYLYGNSDDIAKDIVTEAVHDYMTENL